MSDVEKNKGHDPKKNKNSGRNKKKSSKPKNKRKNDGGKKSGFQGECGDLKGQVFETFMESRDTTQYEKTLKALQVFVASKFRNGGDIGWMLKYEKEFTLEKPTQPISTTTTTRSQDAIDQDIYKEQIKMYVSRKERYVENKDKLYSVIWGQCSDSIQSKLQSKPTFHNIDESRDCLRLLKEIKGIMFNYESQQYPIISMHMAALKYFTTKQGKFEGLTEYYKRFKTTVEILEHYGANIWYHPSLILKEYEDDGHEDVTINTIHHDRALYEKYGKVVKNRAIAFAFLKGAQNDRYGKLTYDLKSQYSMENNNYPVDLNQAFRLLSTHERKTKREHNEEKKPSSKGNEDEANEEKEEMAFVQSSKTKVPECFFCGGTHFLSTCPYRHQMKKTRLDEESNPRPTTSANTMLIQDELSCTVIESPTNDDDEDAQDDTDIYNFAFTTISSKAVRTQPLTTTQQIVLSQESHGNKINPNWILLDSQSTINIFNNKRLFKYIRQCRPNENVRCYCNGGYQDTNQIGEVPGIGLVYYNVKSLENILSLSQIDDKYRVTYDSDVEKAFVVHGTNSGNKRFVRSSGGLHYYDTSARNSKFIMMQTVSGNKSNYTKKEIEAADKAVRLYHAIGRPGYKVFYDTLQKGLIHNCTTTVQDAKNAFQIYGADEGALMGKSTRATPKRVDTNNLYSPPIEFTQKYKYVTLAIDILFFDNIPFILTISRDINFYTVEKLTDRENTTILECLKRVISIYNARGFYIQYILADGEFRHMSGDIISEFKCHLNCTAAGEHVPEAERAVRTIKERIRCIVNTWPYTTVPQVFKISLMKFVIFWINSIPQENSILPNICSKAIMTGQFPDFNKHCTIGFGTYVHVHNPRNITNTMAPRTSPAIALGPISNLQGSHRFFCLHTKRIINRRQWTELPIPKSVIDLIHSITMKERKRTKKKKLPPQDEYTIVSGQQSTTQTIQDSDVPIYTSVQSHADPIDQINGTGNTPMPSKSTDSNGEEDTESTNEQAHATTDANDTTDHSTTDATSTTSKVQDDTQDNNDATSTTTQEVEDTAITHTYNTRGSRGTKPRQYDKVYGSDYTFAIALTQMSASRGIKKFGQRAIDALATEWEQLDTLSVFKGRDYDSLSKQDRCSALKTVQLIKEKKDGKIKGRTCVNGSRQRLYTAEEDASSPTVSTEALLITAAVDAAEERFVATCDITGAFLKADMDEFVLIVLHNEEIDALIQANQKYKEYVKTLNNGKRVLYLELEKAMYGCLKSARLFWDHLSNYLSKMGFKQNDYDLCVANKTVENEVCTVAWHVDDLKISHKDEKVVMDVIQQLEDEYGKMSITTGPVHNYCGMTLRFENKCVKVDMSDYLKDTVNEFPEDCSKSVTTPAAVHLFEVNEKEEKLDAKKKQLFHTFVAKLLFVSKRGRPDIQVAIAFLSTRVTAPDLDDWKKLVRLLRYINSTLELVLTLSVDNFNSVKWWVDASYATHHNSRSHTGGTMTMGKGSIFSTSCKQKINARSSTEAELIGINDVVGQILWTKNFLNCQGYDIETSIVHQDNKSAMLLEQNGILSSSKRTKHINVRYYFIKDYIDKKEIHVIYCPTEEMIADYFTKPLQGSKFVQFRDIIMGTECFDSLNKERVAKTEGK